MNVIPEVLNHFNVTLDRVLSVSPESWSSRRWKRSRTPSKDPGVLGEIEDPVTGQFSSMKMKIPFATLYEDMFSIMNTTKPPAAHSARIHAVHGSIYGRDRILSG